MAEIAPTFSLGREVELDRINPELKKLWSQDDGVMTRASLVNLAIYSERPGSLIENTGFISQLTANHAARAIVIEARPEEPQDSVEAWISAHCHVSRAGSKQVCSEQISFRLHGPCARLLPNIVFSHLDSDLPFFLWWQGELDDPMDSQLWAWVDRFIYDSRGWKDFDAQMRLVETAQAEAKQRIVLCDLNWTRLDKVRIAIAQFFDHPASHHHFASIERLEVQCGAGDRSTALLLIGWLAAQLDWKLSPKKDKTGLTGMREGAGEIEIQLREKGNRPIEHVRLESAGTEFVVRYAGCGDLLEVFRSGPNERALPQMMPAQSDDPVGLMSQELIRGGQHHVYLRALASVRALL